MSNKSQTATEESSTVVVILLAVRKQVALVPLFLEVEKGRDEVISSNEYGFSQGTQIMGSIP